ncbi:MAG: hypothetical protein ACRCVN_01480 [Spirochaetia bacterium]
MRSFIYLLLASMLFPLQSYGSTLLDIAMKTLTTNPYRAQKIFSAIDKSQILNEEKKRQYALAEKALLSFKFPIHKLGLTTHAISAMALDGDDLWVADTLGTISRYTLTSGEYTLIRKPQQSQPMQDVHNIFVQEDRIWIAGTHSLLTYDKKSGEIFSSILPKGGRPISLVYYENQLLLGIENFGIYTWNGEAFVPSVINRPEFVHMRSLVIHQQALWAATTTGLYTNENNHWQQISVLEQQSITALTPSTQGLWGVSQKSTLFLLDQDKNLAIINTDISISEIHLLPECVLILNAQRDRLQQLKLPLEKSGVDLRVVSIEFSTLSGMAFSSPYLIVGSTQDAAFFIHQSLL